MKKLILGLLLLVSFSGWGQQDTTYVDNFSDFNKEFLSQLTPSIYGGSLINRSSMEVITLRQLLGNDDEPHNWENWMFLYSDIYSAYADNTARNSVEEIYLLLEKWSFDYKYPDTSLNTRPIAEEVYNVPFALIIEDISKLKDSSDLVNYAEIEDGKLVPIGNEAVLYEKFTFKSAAVLNMYNPLGFDIGKLHYEQDLIVHSSNVTINSIAIDVGNGYTPFSSVNNTLDFTISTDTSLAKVAVNYTKDGVSFNDTLNFILAIQPSRTSAINKNSGLFDYKYSMSITSTSLQFDVGIIIGCGNQSDVETMPPPFDHPAFYPESAPMKNLKRPIIILPPYKPKAQDVSMEFYFNKYNIDGFLDEMVSKGYDIIIIRQEPGSFRISTNGNLAAEFIHRINEIKGHNFPEESWENILMGFSAGGQHARYALNALEWRHMTWGTPHHHTRLYIPFDSPHNGANVPIGSQAAFWEYRRTGNPIAIGVYNSLNDDASKDLLSHHISSNLIGPFGPGTFLIEQSPAFERVQLMDELEDDFNHMYSFSDERKTFPSFTRNIAVSMGRYDKDYDQEYGLGSRELLFRQIVPVFWLPGFGFRSYNNALFASPSTNQHSPEKILRRNEFRGGGLFSLPVLILRVYTTSYSPGLDQARGGHKNVFYDGLENPWAAQFIGAVQIMRSSAFGFGVKHYKNNVSFMPLTSAFAIKNGNSAEILQNFNPQNEGMMFQKIGFDPLTDKSNHFGYPHLGRPNDHFDITPFEAIYTDNQTYEHIDPINTVDPSKVHYLDSMRIFMRDEIEGKNYYLQNKTIGENHANWLPNDYKYKAWYKADKKLHIGHEVTPKTNKGDYIIEKTGDITVYAGEQIIMKPGFHTQSGSTYHAFIKSPPCTSSGMSQNSNNNDKKADENHTIESLENNSKEVERSEVQKVKIYPNPNRGSFTIEINELYVGCEFVIYDTFGKKLYQEILNQNKTLTNYELDAGVYFVTLIKGNNKHTQKIIVQ